LTCAVSQQDYAEDIRGQTRSHAWLRWINQREVHRPDAANGDDGRLAVATNDTVVVRRSSDPADEVAGGHWNAGSRIEICSTVAPPCSRQRRSDRWCSGSARSCSQATTSAQRVVETRLVRVAGEQAVVDVRLGMAASASAIVSAASALNKISRRSAEWVTATSRPVTIPSAHWGNVPPSPIWRPAEFERSRPSAIRGRPQVGPERGGTLRSPPMPCGAALQSNGENDVHQSSRQSFLRHRRHSGRGQ
jgi:hypothetical protein